MRLLLCLLLLTLACGEPVTAPKPASTEGCEYVQTFTQNGYTVTAVSYLPPSHPLCPDQ